MTKEWRTEIRYYLIGIATFVLLFGSMCLVIKGMSAGVEWKLCLKSICIIDTQLEKQAEQFNQKLEAQAEQFDQKLEKQIKRSDQKLGNHIKDYEEHGHTGIFGPIRK